MNRIALTSVLLLAGCGVTASALAGEPVAADETPVTVAEADAADARKDENIVIAGEGLTKPRIVNDTGCVRSTGTLIRRKPDANGCNGLPGSSYSREDLDRTGAGSTAEALERLDSRL
ncbi:hypothetical protein [Arenimonas composti]|uniref:Secreted protein n=1 Tax=Arenimonas composti TR7-09 = DSM 18010 TaxID=1121013 RepID=A0A091BWA1_9GAMM|nr:hypothetical protein [Arenimonas composti]KFN48625.1 hypothetical protein P873_14090 [Arenimonas composti TR7-09 = DSM 18010]